jgi:hypothetical protein
MLLGHSDVGLDFWRLRTRNFLSLYMPQKVHWLWSSQSYTAADSCWLSLKGLNILPSYLMYRSPWTDTF